MSIQLAFFLRDEHKVGFYSALLAITSLLILLGGYFTLRQQDTILVHAPNDDSLILAWWGWTIIAILSLLIFIYAFRKNVEGIDKVIAEDRENRLNDKLDPEFPLTSATQLLVEYNTKMYDQINFLYFIVMLCFGWTIVIVPFIIVALIFYGLSFIVSSINVEGSADGGAIFAYIVIWLVGIIVMAGFHGLYHASKDIQILTNKLSKLDVNTMLEDDEDS